MVTTTRITTMVLGYLPPALWQIRNMTMTRRGAIPPRLDPGQPTAISTTSGLHGPR